MRRVVGGGCAPCTTILKASIWGGWGVHIATCSIGLLGPFLCFCLGWSFQCECSWWLHMCWSTWLHFFWLHSFPFCVHSILSLFVYFLSYRLAYSMLSSFTRQAEPQQNYVLPQRKPLRNDLEAARQGVSELLPLRAGGRLKKAVRNLEHDFNHLEKKQRPELREDLFWYQDFGARSPHAFRFSNTDTFATLLIKLRSTLKHSSKSTSSNLQIW